MTTITPSAARRRATGNWTRWFVALTLLACIGGVVGAGPAQAQIAPPGVDDLSMDACIVAEMDDGATEAAAARECVNEPAAFDRCMAAAGDTGISVNEALDRCLLADAQSTDPGPDPTVQATTTPATESSAPDQPATSDSESGSSGVPVLLVGVIAIAAAAAGALLAVAGRRTAGPTLGAAPPQTPGPSPAPVQHASAPAEITDPDRSTLVMALIETADVVSSEAVRNTVTERLRAAGVSQIVVAAGVPFDPTVHRGVQAEPAPRPELTGTVVRTDRPGWSDRGTVLRPPEVIVYRQGDAR